MRIRSADIGDVDAITRTINAAFLEAERSFVDGSRIDEGEVRRLMTEGVFLVGTADDAVIGCVYVSARGGSAYLGLLSVLPGHQAHGSGSALLAAGERWCAEAGCAAIDIRVVNLREELPPYYRRHGYVECGTEPFSAPSKRPCHFILMRKDLASPPPTASGPPLA